MIAEGPNSYGIGRFLLLRKFDPMGKKLVQNCVVFFRISFQSSELADLLWKRVKGYLKDIVIDGDPHDIHIEGISSFMKGTWSPKGLNDVSSWLTYNILSDGKTAKSQTPLDH